MSTITDGSAVTDLTETEADSRAAFVAALRAAADFFEATPELDVPYGAYLGLSFYGSDAKSRLAHAARNMGNVTKDVDTWDFIVTRDFGAGVKLHARASRELVCEKVEIGTQPVERQVPKGEVEYETVVVDEPVYEYVCPESLLRPDVAVSL